MRNSIFRHRPLWTWVMLVIALCALLLALFFYRKLEEHNIPVGELTTFPKAESDLERRAREAQRLGSIVMEHVDRIRKNALFVPTDKEIEEKMIEGVYRIDEYSEYMRSGGYDKHVSEKTGTYKDLGILSVVESKGIRILDVYMNSPAERAGLNIGDLVLGKIVQQKKEFFADKTDAQIGASLSGSAGDLRKLIVQKKNGRKMNVVVQLAEETVKPTVVRVELFPGRYGYLQIRSFVQGQTAKEFREALQRLSVSGKKLSGLVIDLRNCLGGESGEAKDIAGFLLPEGVIISTWNRNEGRKDILKKGKTLLSGVPVVILVNRFSASASEILAGALAERDVPRATLMGEKTYGKGVIQLVTTLPNGDQVKLTTWEFFSPKNGGTAIHKVGITPSVVLELEPTTYLNDPWRDKAIAYLRTQKK